MHDRKKGGERKDKKNERMHESVEYRHQMAHPHKTTDQKDVTPYKPGSRRDDNVDPSARHDQHK